MPSPPHDQDSVDEAIDTILEDYGAYTAGADLGRLLTKDEARHALRTLIAGEVVKELEMLKALQCPWPESVFTPMKDEDWPKLAELVKTNLGFPIDRISGDNMRHAWNIYVSEIDDRIAALQAANHKEGQE